MKTSPQELHVVLVTDCGSTTTKALLFERTAEGWRQTHRGEAPTTVEEPVADVTVGALNAFREIEELSGRKVLATDGAGSAPFTERGGDGSQGIDLYLSTSSAGGGLQMLVSGVVRDLTAESAQRAALGAGAIVLEVLSADDRRDEHERIRRVRHLRPDIVLLTGGVEQGSKAHVIEAAELLRAAAPRPRFGETLKLPVIYAGNSDAAAEVQEILAPLAQVKVVPNVRPSIEIEDLVPAREAIHDFFLTHVMSHSPGYDKLLAWTPVPVMPTPAAVGEMIERFARAENLNVLCADIGGATTDIFSVFRNREGAPVFNRTVSANLGMSYSVANVLVEAGIDAIVRWLPVSIEPHEVRDRLRNKMIRPTSIPQTREDLWLEQAVCREALRLSLRHHRALAVGLGGGQRQRTISEVFTQSESRYELVDMRALDMVIGSGGVLSHAPDRLSAALMMLEGFGLEGLTEVAVDSIFMLPHLGVFAAVHPDAATEIFARDCLVRICHTLAPRFKLGTLEGTELADVLVGGLRKGFLKAGDVELIDLPAGEQVSLKVVPRNRHVNVGAGPGVTLERVIRANPHGLILDGRNRPLNPEGDTVQANRKVLELLGVFE